MTTLYLGPSGSEVALPPVRNLSGVPSDQDVNRPSRIESANMADGSIKYNEREHAPRTWTIPFGFLSAAEKAVIDALYATGGAQKFQDNREGATWYDVIILSWTYRRLGSVSADGTVNYYGTLTLGELV